MLLRNNVNHCSWKQDLQHFATLLYQKEVANVPMCLCLHLAHYKRCATSRIVSPNLLHKTSGTLLQKNDREASDGLVVALVSPKLFSCVLMRREGSPFHSFQDANVKIAETSKTVL